MSSVIINLPEIFYEVSNDGCWHGFGPDDSLEERAGNDIGEAWGIDAIVTTGELAPTVIKLLLAELEYRSANGVCASEINQWNRNVFQHNSHRAMNYMSNFYGEGCEECSAWIEYEPENEYEELVQIDGQEFQRKIDRINIGYAPIYFMFEQCASCTGMAREYKKAKSYLEELQDLYVTEAGDWVGGDLVS